MDKELVADYVEARIPVLRWLQQLLDDYECHEEALILEKRITELQKLLW